MGAKGLTIPGTAKTKLKGNCMFKKEETRQRGQREEEEDKGGWQTLGAADGFHIRKCKDGRPTRDYHASWHRTFIWSC
jgi:hypothetical protein